MNEPGASWHSERGPYLKKLIDLMNHPHCRLMPDFDKFPRVRSFNEEAIEGTRAMMPLTKVVSAKNHNFDAQGNETSFDYYQLIRVVYESGFKGFVTIEYEPWDVKLLPVECVPATKKLVEKAYQKLKMTGKEPGDVS